MSAQFRKEARLKNRKPVGSFYFPSTACDPNKFEEVPYSLIGFKYEENSECISHHEITSVMDELQNLKQSYAKIKVVEEPLFKGIILLAVGISCVFLYDLMNHDIDKHELGKLLLFTTILCGLLVLILKIKVKIEESKYKAVCDDYLERITSEMAHRGVYWKRVLYDYHTVKKDPEGGYMTTSRRKSYIRLTTPVTAGLDTESWDQNSLKATLMAAKNPAADQILHLEQQKE